MPKTIITGGAGFIGSNLAEKLAKLGHKVTIVDNLSNGKLINLKKVKNKIKFIKGDIRNAKFLNKAFSNADNVVHLAAITSVPYSIKHPKETIAVNLKGTMNVLSSAKKNNIKRVIFASSAAVYGDLPGLPKKETSKLKPQSPYAVTKLKSEALCREFTRRFKLDTVIFRFFNVFGPKQDPGSPYSGVISIFISKFASRETPVIFGNGEQSRDFIYIDDLTDALVQALNTNNKRIFGQVFNLANGKKTTLNKLISILSKIFKYKVAPMYKGRRAGDIKHSLASISKARKELKFKPKATLEYGLKKTIEWIRSGK
jgi:nucleoside-diphosphate-sugar epimerase